MNIDKFKAGMIFKHAIKITDEVMREFADISGDYNKLHTDAEFCRNKGYKERVAYGNILGMLISALVGMKLPTENVMIISESIAFIKPVYVNDTVVLYAEAVNISPAVSIVDFSLSFTNQDKAKVGQGKLQIKVF
jgi:3-hydroxybutyryl-CoA dehydratase